MAFRRSGVRFPSAPLPNLIAGRLSVLCALVFLSFAVGFKSQSFALSSNSFWEPFPAYQAAKKIYWEEVIHDSREKLQNPSIKDHISCDQFVFVSSHSIKQVRNYYKKVLSPEYIIEELKSLRGLEMILIKSGDDKLTIQRNSKEARSKLAYKKRIPRSAKTIFIVSSHATKGC